MVGCRFLAASESAFMRGNPYVQLSGVVLLWAVNIVLVKVALSDAPPMALTCLRFAGGVVLFGAIAWVLGIPLVPRPNERLALAAIGIVQFGLVSAFSAAGLSFVPAGRASVLLYTMQIWALPLGYWIGNDQPTRTRVLGVAVASIGLVGFLGPWLVDWSDRRTIVGYAILIGTAILWAFGSCLYRARSWQTPSLTQIIWQIAFSAGVLACLSMVFESGHPIRWTSLVWVMLVFNWIAGTVLAYWWWAGALKIMPASQAGQFATLVPVVVFLLSLGLLGEDLSLGVLTSALMILMGIIITARTPAPARSASGKASQWSRGLRRRWARLLGRSWPAPASFWLRQAARDPPS
jgi:drug/metabolite transporter (DMT)-like permease